MDRLYTCFTDSIGNVPVENFVVVSRHDRPIRNLVFNAPITITDLQVSSSFISLLKVI